MRPQSIVVPIVLLVVAAVAVATAALFVITFSGPPPFARPIPVPEIAQVLRQGEVPRPLRNRIIAGEDGWERARGVRDAALDARIARALGVPAEQIEGRYQHGRGPKHDALIDGFAIRWNAPGAPRYVRSAPLPLLNSWHRVTIASMLVLLLGMGAAGWLVARRISQPIRDLAAAAASARLGSRTVIPHRGPREVRELAVAVETMQARILEAAEGRTTMLAAIAHDLGTPLSRIAFHVEQLPEAARDRAAADLAEMRAMLQEALRFARDLGAGTPHERLDLGSLIESLADDLAAGGAPVEALAGPRIVIAGDSAGLRRLFANLAENAVRYGARARLSWGLAEGGAEVIVDDDGPGFDPATAEGLFAPFVRGEASRNRDTGGSGLGLAIVRAIAEAHGGSAVLETRAGGGGRVRVRLPAIS